MCIALQLLQKLVLSAEQIGAALVPYYRQACNAFHASDQQSYKGLPRRIKRDAVLFACHL